MQYPDTFGEITIELFQSSKALALKVLEVMGHGLKLEASSNSKIILCILFWWYNYNNNLHAQLHIANTNTGPTVVCEGPPKDWTRLL